MSSTGIKIDVDVLRAEIVKTYTDVSTEPGQEYIFPTGRGWAEELGYPEPELGRVPEATVESFAGVANHWRLGRIEPGSVVLDLGCGAGTDLLVAAQMTGPDGRAVGVDMTPSMLTRARDSAQRMGMTNVELHETLIEALPLDDDSVDVVISNGVINLSSRKSRALAEIARVLRPGGRLCFTDLVVDGDLPPEVLASEAAWAGCIAGAVSERVLGRKLERVGFDGIDIGGHTPFSLDDVARYPLFTRDIVQLMRRLLTDAAQARVADGVTVRAVKRALPPPDGGGRGAVADSAPARARKLEDIPPDAVEAPGVTVRHLKEVDDVHLKALDVEPGGSTPFHRHPHAHEGVVVEGSGALRLADGRTPLVAGTVFSVRPNEAHAIEGAPVTGLRFVCMDCFVE
jgi:arsenite methyltransferase